MRFLWSLPGGVVRAQKTFVKVLRGFDPAQDGAFSLIGEFLREARASYDSPGKVMFDVPDSALNEGDLIYIGARIPDSSGSSLGATMGTLLEKGSGGFSKKLEEAFIDPDNPQAAYEYLEISTGQPDFKSRNITTHSLRAIRSAHYAIGMIAQIKGLIPLAHADKQEIANYKQKLDLATFTYADNNHKPGLYNQTNTLPDGIQWFTQISGAWVFKMPDGTLRFADCLLPYIGTLRPEIIRAISKDVDVLGGVVEIVQQLPDLNKAMHFDGTKKKQK